MNNYEEEYFEDENGLEDEHFGDFVDFWDDTPEFDEQIEEFKTALRADVKREIKELIERLQKELERYPKYKQAYLRAFEKMLINNKASIRKWETAQDVMDWWLGLGNQTDEAQMQMLESEDEE